jgi:hypothetical protein
MLYDVIYSKFVFPYGPAVFVFRSSLEEKQQTEHGLPIKIGVLKH